MAQGSLAMSVLPCHTPVGSWQCLSDLSASTPASFRPALRLPVPADGPRPCLGSQLHAFLLQPQATLLSFCFGLKALSKYVQVYTMCLQHPSSQDIVCCCNFCPHVIFFLLCLLLSPHDILSLGRGSSLQLTKIRGKKKSFDRFYCFIFVYVCVFFFSPKYLESFVVVIAFYNLKDKFQQ